MSAPREAAGRPAGRADSGVTPTCGVEHQAATTLTPSSVHPPTTYAPRGRAARLREKLGERELAVLASLASLRLMTGAQIQRLHLADGSPGTQARRTRALMQRLTELRLVVRLGRRVGGARMGSAGFVYGISGHGQAVLGVDGLHGGRRRRVWETEVSFQKHVLAVCDLHVALVEAERSDALELLDFQAEPQCWRRFPGPHGQAVTLKPDVFVRLAIGDFEHSAFCEIDMGTESGPTIARKCDVYVAYWRGGIEQAAHEVFPRVLWLGANERSVQRITGVLAKLPRDVRRLFHVAYLSDAVGALTATAPGGPMA